MVISLLSNNEPARQQVALRLQARFGSLVFISSPLPFNSTAYYADEMGMNLDRRFLLFARLVPAARLAVIKRVCISIENDFSARGRRMVNIDPGVMSSENFVLATTKPNAHRLLIGNDIYGEITLLFQHGKYAPLAWTYPDYGSAQYCDLFLSWRNRYLWQLKQMEGSLT